MLWISEELKGIGLKVIIALTNFKPVLHKYVNKDCSLLVKVDFDFSFPQNETKIRWSLMDNMVGNTKKKKITSTPVSPPHWALS